MEIKDFIKKLAEVYEEANLSDFTPETDFKDFDEWSSLTSLSIVAMVGDEYGVIIRGDEIRQAKTVQDLFDIVAAKK